jgi:HSP20 family molecular chaperone IbpA
MTMTQVHTYPPHGKVVEEADEYVVELDVAEFSKDELDVNVDGDVVTITGDQHRLDRNRLALSERLEECFRLPGDACGDELRTEFGSGTIEIHIPRRRFAVNPEATPC